MFVELLLIAGGPSSLTGSPKHHLLHRDGQSSYKHIIDTLHTVFTLNPII